AGAGRAPPGPGRRVPWRSRESYSKRRRRGKFRGSFHVMANIASQKKRIRRAAREQAENRRYTSKVKTCFRRLEAAAADADAAKVETEHLELVRTIDKAVGKGAPH